MNALHGRRGRLFRAAGERPRADPRSRTPTSPSRSTTRSGTSASCASTHFFRPSTTQRSGAPRSWRWTRSDYMAGAVGDRAILADLLFGLSLRHALRDRGGRRRHEGRRRRRRPGRRWKRRLRRHACRHHAADRHPAAVGLQPDDGRKAARGRHDGRSAGDGLVHADLAPGAAATRWARAAGTSSTPGGSAPTSSTRCRSPSRATRTKGWFGWPEDEEMEEARAAFATRADPGGTQGDRDQGAGAAVGDRRLGRNWASSSCPSPTATTSKG